MKMHLVDLRYPTKQLTLCGAGRGLLRDRKGLRFTSLLSLVTCKACLIVRESRGKKRNAT